VSFLAVDAEMSSLQVEQGDLLSLGWVSVSEGAIDLSSARHLLVQPRGTVGQSATIHKLRDCEVAAGDSAAAALEQFLEASAGKVLVFHNATLDLAYLDRLCTRLHGAPLLQPHVCTLRLEQRQLVRREQLINAGDLTLNACRARYGLPAYNAHNALWDALATAELLLAQVSHRAAGRALPLSALTDW
jgi:DNA polymerase-3 subunit epsilon